ncbi:WXG100 family type VII secretion target [Nocardia cyriacigeorgica]|uniref:WXG100 family type VII secretion target n=1 Tax=Nocardia cyriacigeorgica TaxID=135487 RepID=UPI00189639C8|nr:WXG100 family type VII secretion target [Nocardia cyriacigeorgica]MBF6438675.1 WXG100 family type VII secretion target [Nocardia cyriacigeorgica]
MSNIIADFGAMEASAGHVETVNGQLASELSRIGTLVAGSEGNWKGEAAKAFQGVMNDYRDASDRLHTVLQEIADSIRKNGKGFTDAEQAHLDSIHKAGASGELGKASSLNIQS